MSALQADDLSATPLCADADIYESRFELDGKRIVELGCGAGENARAIAATGHGRSVIAFEVDRVQHAKNLAAPAPSNLEFRAGGAERIELPDGSAEFVFMFKSLHHVPPAAMDRAMDEIARVLVPGGRVYVSEPVFAGDFNEVLRLFHDEQAVRRAAYEAICRAVERGVLARDEQVFFRAPVRFESFEAFESRVINATHTQHVLTPAVRAAVEARFARHLGPDGARFEAPMRVDLLRKPAA